CESPPAAPPLDELDAVVVVEPMRQRRSPYHPLSSNEAADLLICQLHSFFRLRSAVTSPRGKRPSARPAPMPPEDKDETRGCCPRSRFATRACCSARR